MSKGDEEEDENVEKKRVMKHAVPLSEDEEFLFEYYKESSKQKVKPLTEQEKDQFWDDFYREFLIYKQEEECADSAILEVVDNLDINKQDQRSDEEIEIISKTDNIVHNSPVRILFFGGMVLNILWMQLLIHNYGNNLLIQIIKWAMIILTGCITFSWIKAYRLQNGGYAND